MLARLTSTATEDPLDDLVGAAPPRVREWMQRKARLADGCTVGLPVCSGSAVETAVQDDRLERGPWQVHDGGRSRDGTELARVGLLRDLCGLTWQGVILRAGASEARVRRGVEHHRRLLLSTPTYASRAALVAGLALERTYGAGHAAVRGPVGA